MNISSASLTRKKVSSSLIFYLSKVFRRASSEVRSLFSFRGVDFIDSLHAWENESKLSFSSRSMRVHANKARNLLNEIMQAGNFGKYDDRFKKTPSIPLLRGKKVPVQLWHAIEKTKHNLRLLTHYPEEVICEPFFRVYHWVWRYGEDLNYGVINRSFMFQLITLYHEQDKNRRGT